MQTIANALLPLIVVLAAGLMLRRSGFLDRSFWDQAENLSYYVLMPVLLVRTIGGSQLGDVPWGDMVTVLYGATFGAAALLLAGYGLLRSRVSGPLFTSVFQGGVRYNTYIALAIIETMFGATGIAIGGVLAGFLIIAINLVLVGVMATVLHTGGSALGRMLREFIRNPLILACLTGGLINVSGVMIPVWLDGSMAMVSRMALPVALLCVGASLSLRRLKGDLVPALVSSTVQFAVKPSIAFGLAVWLGLPVMATSIVVIFMAVPTAVSSYIFARKMGGDQETMATIITFQTIAAFAVLTVVLGLLQRLH